MRGGRVPAWVIITQLDPLAAGRRRGDWLRAHRRTSGSMQRSNTRFDQLLRSSKAAPSIWSKPLPVLGRNRDKRQTLHLRQPIVKRAADTVEQAAGAFRTSHLLIAIIKRAAFFEDVAGDLEILMFKALRGVEQQDHNLGKIHGALGICDRKAFPAFP